MCERERERERVREREPCCVFFFEKKKTCKHVMPLTKESEKIHRQILIEILVVSDGCTRLLVEILLVEILLVCL